jgi:hypothetical protein
MGPFAWRPPFPEALRGKAAAKRSWEIIADNLSKAGWSLGCVSAIDSNGRTLRIVDAHRVNGKRFVVRSDEMLSAFLELERITHALALSALVGDDSN